MKILWIFWGLSQNWTTFRGGTRISGKGVHVYKDVGVRFADFISFFSSIPGVKMK